MRHGKISREEVAKMIVNGADVLDRLDAINCEPTSRCQTDGDDDVEWSASIRCVDTDGVERELVAYYYISQDDMQTMADNDGDATAISWEIEGYEII